MAEVWGDATVLAVGEGSDRHAVVTRADTHILFSDELMDEVSRGYEPATPGEAVRDGELVSFGTAGEGLGRLTYRIVGHDDVWGWHQLRLVDLDVLTTENKSSGGAS